MKKYLLIPFALFFISICQAQIRYEPGYFVDNNGKKTSCLIRNVDWKNNPTAIEYKISSTDEATKATIKDIREFRVENGPIYLRRKVEMDRSPDENNRLDHDKTIALKEEVVFLKKLISGEANLYYYEDNNLRRFFFETKDSELKQLSYKRYRKSVSEIGTVNTYKQQLFNSLKCDAIKRNVIDRTAYKKDDLSDLFLAYNRCKDSNYTVDGNDQERLEVNLTLRPGLHFSGLSIDNDISNARDTDFDNGIGLRFGAELEAVLPFNQGKWALFIEPTYQSYSKEATTTPSGPIATTTAKVKYQSLEFPMGLRHYMILNEKSKVFINMAYVYDKSFGSSIDFENGNDLDIKSGSNLAFGLGYTNTKISLEARYATNRELLREYPLWTSSFGGISIIFGYTIF